MDLRSMLIGVILLLFAPGSFLALHTASPPKPNKGAGCGVTTQAVAATGTGVISGVLYTNTQQPLSGAEVWLCRLPSGSGGGRLVGTSTSLDGSYSFTGLEDGSYRLLFADPRGQYGYQYWNLSESNAPSTSYASLIYLSGGMHLRQINKMLQPAGRIRGVVRNQLGARLANIRVSIDIRDLSGIIEDTPIDHVVSGSDGSYVISGLPTSDRYQLTFRDPQGSYNPATLEASATSGSTTSGTNVILSQAGGILFGSVTDGRRGPLEGILVTPYRASEPGVWQPLPAAATLTDAAGAYQLLNLPTGSYRIGFSDPSGRALPRFYQSAPGPDGASTVSVEAERTVGGIDAALTLYSRIYLPLVLRS